MMKTSHFLLGFGYLTATIGVAQSPFSPLPSTVLERKTDSLFANANVSNTPGGVIAVLYKGDVLLKKGYGMANIANKIPLTTASLFNIASTAKQFTATCIALLEEQGKLSFEDDIRTYFPQFQIKKTITIRHLISHTSGLREAYVLAALSGKVNLKGQVRKQYKTTAHLVQLMAKQQELNFEPGHEFAYTNINYILLGEIVRKVSGLSLAEFADQFIFKPLGMTHTYFNDPLAVSRSGRAIPYQLIDAKKQRFKPLSIRNDQGVVGDNNLITSVDDLIRWDQNFTTNRLGLGKQSFVKTLQTPYILSSGDTIHYAFGLNVTPYKTTRSIGHGGDDYRYTSLMMRFPAYDLDLIYLSNQSDYQNTQQKVFALADVLLNVSAPLPTLVPEPLQASLPFDSLYFKPFTGQYMGNGAKNRYSFREVFIRNGKPYLSFQPQPNKHVFELLPIGRQHYRFKVEEPNVYVEAWFTDHKEGGQARLSERFKTDTLHYDRRLTAPSSTPKLTQFTGIFRCQELDGQLKVKVKRHGLTIKRGLITINTIPIGEDTFYAPENRAIFYFKRDKTGLISEFLISAVDFRNVRYSR
ncbi:serine hydrolase domain-containing protein [Spirosoma pollinicola]|uniref:Beta-lactamase-related domain-containing protein n=1 Tax=Spirosoma pollinicola TaxID=2057025 RepID=A0A2K8Z2J9_9BACT|nr:serine hydrolase domain-containing protein [Spirosoma pollinicola]AUD04103.1 hypothetical protein CWM47_21075 [Spirosoma pollinicola]